MPTQVEFAEHMGISPGSVSKLAKQGVLKKGGSLDDWRRAYVRLLIAQASGHVSQDGKLDLVAERFRLTHHQANIAAMEEEALRGNLLPRQAVNDVFRPAFKRLLAVPREVAGQAAAIADADACESLIREAIRKALTDIAGAAGAGPKVS